MMVKMGWESGNAPLMVDVQLPIEELAGCESTWTVATRPVIPVHRHITDRLVGILPIFPH